MEHGKYFHSTAATTSATSTSSVVDVVPSLNTATLLHHRINTTSFVILVVPTKGSQRHVQTKKVKGPNQLSCKKKKAAFETGMPVMSYDHFISKLN